MIDTDDVAAVITAAGFTPRVDIPMPVKAGEVTVHRSVEHDNRYIGSAYRFNQRFDMIAHVSRDEAQVLAAALREMGIADLDENIDVAEPAAIEEIGFLPWVVRIDTPAWTEDTFFGLFDEWDGVGALAGVAIGFDFYEASTSLKFTNLETLEVVWEKTLDPVEAQTIIFDFLQNKIRFNGTWYSVQYLEEFDTVNIAWNSGAFDNLYAWKRTSLPVKPRVSTSEMTTGKRFKSRVVHRIMMETRAESA